MKDKVKCKICNCQFKQITYKHLKKHDITIQQYCKKFNLISTDLISQLSRSKLNTASKQRWVDKYGQHQGLIKFNQYRERQAYTNSFQYKQKKLGWNKQQFNQYNKSRAVTLQNCIGRHGVKQGTKIFQQYCNKQAYAGVKLQYFIQKYGQQKGLQIYKQIGKQKAQTLQNMCRRYGNVNGVIKWQHYLKHNGKGSFGKSKISQQLFDSISNIIGKQNVKYSNNQGEHYIIIQGKTYYIDFYDIISKKSIQFYGSYWHADPNKYNQSDIIKYPYGKILAKKVWQKDKKRIDNILKSGEVSEFKIVWQFDYYNDKQKIIKQCIQFLKQEKK